MTCSSTKEGCESNIDQESIACARYVTQFTMYRKLVQKSFFKNHGE